MTGEYLAKMEDVLSLYHLPFDEKRPVICLDELPFQMLGEKVAPTEMKPGAVKKFDYEYERKGVASVFVAFEPLTGKRIVRVYPRRYLCRLLPLCSGSRRAMVSRRSDRPGSG